MYDRNTILWYLVLMVLPGKTNMLTFCFSLIDGLYNFIKIYSKYDQNIFLFILKSSCPRSDRSLLCDSCDKNRSENDAKSKTIFIKAYHDYL